MLYLDTSAVLPYYREEAHSEAMQELLLHSGEPIAISELTRVDFASALARWVRMGELEEAHGQRVHRAFDEDVAADRYSVRAILPEHMELARGWLRTTPLRTLDALHLACVAHEDAELMTFDEAMSEAAKTLGIRMRRL